MESPAHLPTGLPPRNPKPSAMPVLRMCSWIGPWSRIPGDIVSVEHRPSCSQPPQDTPPPHPHTPSRQLRLRERQSVVGQAGGDGVRLHPLARFLHQIGEGRQRDELAGGEEVAEGRQPVDRGLEASGDSQAWRLPASTSVVPSVQWLPSPASAQDRPARDPPRQRWPSAARPCDQPCLRHRM